MQDLSFVQVMHAHANLNEKEQDNLLWYLLLINFIVTHKPL